MNDRKRNINPEITRRNFLGKAAATATAASVFNIVPRHVLGGKNFTAPSDILRLAGIGCGSHSAFFFPGIIQQTGSQMVALCDVDTEFPKKAIKRTSNLQNYIGTYSNPLFAQAPRFQYYQEMLERDDLDIDAVLIATPDHQHMPISIAAINKGKHVYCEKNLGVNISEVRQATQLAKSKGVVTQMGIGNHSRQEVRRIAEAIQSGVIGDVTKVNLWCDDEWVNASDSVTWPPRRVGKPWYNKAVADSQRPYKGPVPDGLDWDAWLGPAKHHPYSGERGYHPRGWRDWWAFGGGRIADIGCHALDWVFFALNLNYPTSVEAKGRTVAGAYRSADWLNVKWNFPARDDRGPVEVNWYDGNTRPEEYQYIQEELSKDYGIDNSNTSNRQGHGDGWARATMFIGTEGILVAQFYPTRWKLFPLAKGSNKYSRFNYKAGPNRIPNSIGHYDEFITGIKKGDPSISQCNFDYSGPISETILLSIAAYRTGKKLEWDPRNLKALRTPEADQFIKGEYRAGWTLPTPTLPDTNYPAREAVADKDQGS